MSASESGPGTIRCGKRPLREPKTPQRKSGKNEGTTFQKKSVPATRPTGGKKEGRDSFVAFRKTLPEDRDQFEGVHLKDVIGGNLDQTGLSLLSSKRQDFSKWPYRQKTGVNKNRDLFEGTPEAGLKSNTRTPKGGSPFL